MDRVAIWYVFGLAAVALIALRLRPTLKGNWRDPVVVSFSGGLFLGAIGTLVKQPLLAAPIDGAFGTNAAWTIADILFLMGLCAGTYWVDLMRLPTLREQGWRLIRRWRVLALGLVSAWILLATTWAAPQWAQVERGGIDVAGSTVLLSARLVYAGFVLWGFAYLSYHFYRQRQHMRDRFNYIRLTIPFAAITLGTVVPFLQITGTSFIYMQPAQLPNVWPVVWALMSGVQAVVALLIVATFFPPAYHTISWLDKQLLLRRLRRTRNAVARSRPDLPLGTDQPGLIVRDPDRWLATLVNELEMAKTLMGHTTYEIEAPAGGLMPDATRYALHEEQDQFLRGLTSKEPLAAPRVTGDTYALARWYVAVGAVL